MKYFIKKRLHYILFAITAIILVSQILYGIYSNIEIKKEYIVGKIDTYYFFNKIKPTNKSIDKFDEFNNIIHTNTNNENIEYKSYILEKLKNILPF